MRIRTGLAAVAVLIAGGFAASPASAGDVTPLSCASEPNVYTFSSVAVSIRPTDLYSGYITGPGSITYNATSTATVSATSTASISAEAGVVFAKASTSLSVGVTAGKSWTSGFSYTMNVAAGQKRRMHLFQQSRSFNVTKKAFNTAQCAYVTVYSNNAANAPLIQQADEWRLES